jgi:hypothetical protein
MNRLYRFLFAAAPLLLVSVQPPAFASSHSKAGHGRAKCEKPKKRGGFMRGLAGRVAGVGLGQVGIPSGIAGLAFPISSLITDAIASRLDCKEQVQAATATTQATRGGVGTSSSWQSETRPDVSGTSTVIAQNNRSDGASCMTVNDVIIVNGEEVTAAKTMCRAPGASGYTLAA